MSWFDSIGSVVLSASQAAKRNRQQQQQQGQQPPENRGPSALENIAGLAGAFLKSKGENDRADRTQNANQATSKAQLLQNHSQFAARLAEEIASGRRGEDLSRAVQAMNASKLGENENFATRNRILSSVLPKMQGGNYRPGDAGVAAAMGTGGSSPFAGGIPPELLAAINERSTANAIAGRNKQLLNIDPNASVADFGAMGFSPEDSEGFDLAGHRQGLLDADAANQTSVDETIQRALLQDYEGIMRLPGEQEEQKKEGFWKKLGKIASIAAPIVAAPFTGGASLALIGAGSGASLAALNGGKAKDIVLGAALGSAAGLGGKKKPAPQTAAATNRMRVVPPVGGY